MHQVTYDFACYLSVENNLYHYYYYYSQSAFELGLLIGSRISPKLGCFADFAARLS